MRYSQRLGHLAVSRSRTVGDECGDHSGAVASVFLVDVLDDFFAPFVLKIDVDVGRLTALSRNEALKKQVHSHGINCRDAQAIADCRVGCRSPALAEDVARASKLDDFPNREEVISKSKVGNEPKLMLELACDGRRDLPARVHAVAGERTFPSRLFEIAFGRVASGDPLAGVAVPELRGVKLASLRQDVGLRDELRPVPPELEHFNGRFEAVLGVLKEEVSCFMDGRALADRDHEVLKGLLRSLGKVHVVCGKEPLGSKGGGDASGLAQPQGIEPVFEPENGDVNRSRLERIECLDPSQPVREFLSARLIGIRDGRRHEGDEFACSFFLPGRATAQPLEDLGAREVGLAFFLTCVRCRDHAAQKSVGPARAGEQDHRIRTKAWHLDFARSACRPECELRSNDELEARSRLGGEVFPGLISLWKTVNAVSIRDGNPRESELGCARDELFGRGGSAQKRVVRAAGELGVRAHDGPLREDGPSNERVRTDSWRAGPVLR